MSRNKRFLTCVVTTISRISNFNSVVFLFSDPTTFIHRCQLRNAITTAALINHGVYHSKHCYTSRRPIHHARCAIILAEDPRRVKRCSVRWSRWLIARRARGTAACTRTSFPSVRHHRSIGYIGCTVNQLAFCWNNYRLRRAYFSPRARSTVNADSGSLPR